MDKPLTNDELVDKLKRNILGCDWSLNDAPFHGFTPDNIKGAQWALRKVLDGTGITIKDLIEESKTARWWNT